MMLKEKVHLKKRKKKSRRVVSRQKTNNVEKK
jgi:hypothetical protein